MRFNSVFKGLMSSYVCESIAFQKLHVVTCFTWSLSKKWTVCGKRKFQYYISWKSDIHIVWPCHLWHYCSLVSDSVLVKCTDSIFRATTSKLMMEAACSCERMVYTYYITTPESICQICFHLLRLVNYHTFLIRLSCSHFRQKSSTGRVFYICRDVWVLEFVTSGTLNSAVYL